MGKAILGRAGEQTELNSSQLFSLLVIYTLIDWKFAEGAGVGIFREDMVQDGGVGRTEVTRPVASAVVQAQGVREQVGADVRIELVPERLREWVEREGAAVGTVGEMLDRDHLPRATACAFRRTLQGRE